jgi:hypothetical protein
MPTTTVGPYPKEAPPVRIRILALSGALAASTLLAAPAMASEPSSPTTQPAPVTTPASAPAEPKFRNSCRPKRATLPKLVQGRPLGFTPGAAKGVYIWHEKAGWRIRVTHPRTVTAGKPTLIEVRGRITSTRPLTNVRTIRLEDKQRGEWVSVQRPKRKVMEFRFVNGGFIDGIDFRAGCSGRLGFTVWEITKDPATGKPVKDPVTGKVVRTPLPVFVGQGPTPVTASELPGLTFAPTTEVSRVVIRRTPVAPAA